MGVMNQLFSAVCDASTMVVFKNVVSRNAVQQNITASVHIQG